MIIGGSNYLQLVTGFWTKESDLSGPYCYANGVMTLAGDGPDDLFKAGEVGVVFDPSDLSTMYQDNVGSIPVTGVEQPVGLILDKSKSAVRGIEQALTVNQNSIAIGGAAFTNYAISSSIANNATVEIIFTVTNYLGSGTVGVAGSTRWVSVPPAGPSGNGTYRAIVTVAAAGAGAVELFSRSTNSCVFTGISVKELPGNHASQATAASRPTLKAKYNKIPLNNVNPTVTTSFVLTPPTNGLATFTVVNDVAALAAAGLSNICTLGNVYKLDNSLGDNVATISTASSAGIVASQKSSAWMRGSGNTFIGCNSAAWSQQPLSAGYTNITDTHVPSSAGAGMSIRAAIGAVVYFILMDFRDSNDAYLPTPQVVRTSVDYDTAGFPYYLSFDGVDDSLQTGNVDLTSTDKVVAFAGITKSNDATVGTFLESSADSNVNNGTLGIFAPVNGATPNLSWRSKGTVLAVATRAAGAVSPYSTVMSCIGDIGNDVVSFEDAGIIYSSAGDQGTGNFGNYPFYIGRRGGITLPFNGRMYSLIVRTGLVSASRTKQIKRYIAGKMGMVL